MEAPRTTVLDEPQYLHDPMCDGTFRDGYRLREDELPQIEQIQQQYREFYEQMEKRFDQIMAGRKLAEEADFLQDSTAR